MAQMVSTCGQLKMSAVLEQFAVVHPNSGRREGEEARKLMFYHPKDERLNDKVQNVGFWEAVIKFTESFASDGGDQLLEVEGDDPFDFSATAADSTARLDSNFHEVQTDQRVHVYRLVERDFIVGATFSKAKADETGFALYVPALNQVLITAYEMFCLFFGRFSKLIDTDSDEPMGPLKDRLDYFFTRYLSTLKLHAVPLLDLYPGVQFMSLDPANFLRVETLVSQVCETQPTIAHALFLYQDQLLWYSVPKRSLAIIYRYMTQNLLPMSLRAELQPETQRRIGSAAHHSGKFVTGPVDLDGADDDDDDDATDTAKLPILYFDDSPRRKSDTTSSSSDNAGASKGDASKFQLVVYRALNATVALLIRCGDSSGEKDDRPPLEFFRRLDAQLGARLTALASALGEVVAAAQTTAPDCHYFFANPLSLSVKSSFFEPANDVRLARLPLPIVRLLCEVHAETVARTTAGCGDVLAKADQDWWALAKRANGRLLFVLLPRPNAALADASDELRRICDRFFENVFPTD